MKRALKVLTILGGLVVVAIAIALEEIHKLEESANNHLRY